jgi:hypothetical protein
MRSLEEGAVESKLRQPNKMLKDEEYLYAINSSRALLKCLESPIACILSEETISAIRRAAKNSTLLLTEVCLPC